MRGEEKKVSDPLRRWLANEIEFRASKAVKDLWKKASKTGWGHLQDKIELDIGIARNSPLCLLHSFSLYHGHIRGTRVL